MVYNATFTNISGWSWRSVLVVEEYRVPGKNHRLPQATDKLHHKMLCNSPEAEIELKTSVVIGTDCKPNTVTCHDGPQIWIGILCCMCISLLIYTCFIIGIHSSNITSNMTSFFRADFVCLYNYEFWLSLCKIVRSSVILLLPLFVSKRTSYPFGIISLAPVNVTDFSIGSINCVRHLTRT